MSQRHRLIFSRPLTGAGAREENNLELGDRTEEMTTPAQLAEVLKLFRLRQSN